MPMADGSVESAESVYDSTQQQPFRPFEPEPVHPSSSPTDLPNSGSGGGTSGEDGTATDQGAAQAAETEQPPPLREFDPRHREPFKGMLYLGRLTHEFTLYGHEFVVKTLTTEESADIGLLCQKYEGTRAAGPVYQTFVVAAATVEADGQRLPEPLGPDKLENLRVRYAYVAENWMPPVREKIFEQVFALEVEVRQILDAMGEASG